MASGQPEINNFAYFYRNVKNISEFLPNAIDYLLENVIEDKAILYEEKTCYLAFIFIGKLVAYETCPAIFDLVYEKEFHVFMSNLIEHYYEIRSQLDFSYKTTELSIAEKSDEIEDRKMIVLQYAFYITNQFFLQSVAISKAYPSTRGFKAHFDFLKDLDFINKNLESNLNLWSSKTVNFLYYITMNISALSKFSEEQLQAYTELDAVNTLLSIKKIAPSSIFNLYLAITNIADDNQIEKLDELHIFAKMLMERLEKCKNAFEENRVQRAPRKIFENNSAIDCNVIYVTEENKTTLTLFVILQGLYKLAVNNKMKHTIFFEYGIKSLFKVILLKGNEYEVKYTLRLIAQLSFNHEIAIDLSNDNEFFKLLNEILTNQQNNQNENEFNSFNLCKKIVWNIESAKNSNKQINITHQDKILDKHIMISYNTASRDLCLKIKSQLESSNFRVWMDVSDIHGSSLDSMAKAVETSSCVLMCVTEKYRQSINCQAEAQYAFKLNKPIIPLIMQQGYEAVTGWLGIIMGDKIFVNFMKYSFEECVKRLKGEISIYYKIDKSNYERTNNTIPTKNIMESTNLDNQNLNFSNNNESEIIKWNCEKVKEWFIKNEISLRIFDFLKPCTGIVLFQLNEMKNECPQFYYQSIKSENIDLNAITIFTFHLKNLFKK